MSEGIEISTDNARLNIEFIFDYLHQHAYWCKGIPRSLVEKSIRHSLCFGIYLNGTQVGFARVISDYTTFGYLGDVFIDKSQQGKGLGKRLMSAVMSHPELQGLRRFSLNTADAHGLYENFGFSPLATPDRGMEVVKPNIYLPD